jgi:hypothetical protein
MNSTKKILLNNNEAIVPIYRVHNCSRSLIGTATILKDGIIMAATHTFYPDDKRLNDVYEIFVKNKFIQLGPPYHYEKDKDQYQHLEFANYEDLSLFLLPSDLDIQSDLILSDYVDDIYFIKGYVSSAEDLYSVICNFDTLDYSKRKYSNDPLIKVTFTNCFRIINPGYEGLSGGPILSGNRVVGMVVYGGVESGTTAIKSNYIRNIISNLPV